MPGLISKPQALFGFVPAAPFNLLEEAGKMELMKIFQVNDKFFNEGGSEVYIRQIASRLKKLGHKLVIVYGDGPEPETVKKEGFSAYQIPGLEEEFPQDTEIVVKVIKEIIAEEKPDVIQINNIQNGDFVQAFLDEAPTMRHVHDHRLVCPGFSKMWYRSNQICPIPVSFGCLVNAYKEHCATNKPQKLLRKYRAKFHEIEVNKKLPKILLASEFMTSYLRVNGFNLEKTVIQPHFVEMPATITSPKNNRNVLFVGRVTIEKGPQYAIQAMQQIDGYLTIVGTGPQLHEYQQLAHNLGLADRVRFVGEVSRGKLGRYYQDTDVVVFPSIWPEPHGKIGPEAFSYGRPVVGFDSGGVKEWLVEGAGFLVPRLDTNTLAEKINYLLDHPNEAKKMGEKGRQLVEKTMNEKLYLKNLVQVYHDTRHIWQKERISL